MMDTLGPKLYQSAAIHEFIRACAPQGKRVLEIGGSNLPPEYIATACKPSQWVCVDHLDSQVMGYVSDNTVNSDFIAHLQKVGVHELKNLDRCPDDPYVVVAGSVHDMSPDVLGQFDAVFSVAAFEHIPQLGLALSRIHDCLKTGGSMMTQFSPIWSSAEGHHYPHYLNSRVGAFDNPAAGVIPDFAHLLWSRDRIAEFMAPFYSPAVIKHTLFSFFETNYINRLFYDDYRAILAASEFADMHVKGMWAKPLDNETMKALEEKFPKRQGFEYPGLRVEAKK